MTTTGRDHRAKNNCSYYLTCMWSPDGRYLVFTHRGRGIPGGLYVMNADGSDIHKVDKARHGWMSQNATFAPGSRELLVMSNKEGPIAIDIDPQSRRYLECRRISTFSGSHGNITVSADGQLVANVPMENCWGYKYNGDGGGHVAFSLREEEALFAVEDRANRSDQHGERKGTRPALLVVDARRAYRDDPKYLQVVCYHYSRNTDRRGRDKQWAHTHAYWSPDGTKIGYNSSMHWAQYDKKLVAEFEKRRLRMDDNSAEHSDIFVVVYRKPDPPQKVRVASSGRKSIVSWRPGKHHNETRGYLVFRAEGRNAPRRLTPRPVPGLVYEDDSAKPGATHTYSVKAEEWSGLLSTASRPATTRPRTDGGDRR